LDKKKAQDPTLLETIQKLRNVNIPCLKTEYISDYLLSMKVPDVTMYDIQCNEKLTIKSTAKPPMTTLQTSEIPTKLQRQTRVKQQEQQQTKRKKQWILCIYLLTGAHQDNFISPQWQQVETSKLQWEHQI